MTVKELYEMAKEKNMENADIIISVGYDGGYAYAGGNVEEANFYDYGNLKTVELINND